ncbi:hypothetical protein ACGFW5_34650 [Streptomyces sp. NPDC048416]|uniref:hypothetical protein n=1 Tax=Streptomyces sp. NPDC048416 TaxID=3365546 RepID=UPI0037204B51
MTTIKRASVRFGMLPLAATLLLAAGCGTQRSGDVASESHGSRPTPTGISSPSAPTDFPCPGEAPKPTPSAAPGTTAPAVAPTDHYAENHGFRVPLELHGQSRCDGLAVVGRVTKALEPLRKRGDFAPQSVQNALTGLGYSAGKVRSYENGPTGVGFLIDIGASPWCVEGTMSSDTTKASAFAGYPDGTGCEPPKGGH